MRISNGCTGGCHSHRLYIHSCYRTQLTVNGQTTRIGAVNGQSGVKKMVNVQVLQFAPNLSVGVTHVRSAYFLTYRLADTGCSSNVETSLQAKYLSGQRSISVVNGQTAKERQSKF